MRKINSKGFTLLTKFEGCRLSAYKDIGGVLTIGYGHTGPEVVEGMLFTQVQANAQLEKDLEKLYRLDEHLSEQVNDNQYSALICLAFNIGLNSLLKSALIKKVNAGESPDGEWTKWSHVNGKVVNGLLRRRVAELELYHEIG